jgi:diguanylate cyclase (GGDEF)-like protein/PAS domain S-box-containing protein
MGPSNKSATTFETLKRQLDVARDGIEAQVAERTATLKASEEKFRALVEMTSDWIWEVDVSGIYTYTSPRVEALLGFKPEEVLGKTPFDFMLPEEAGRIKAEFANIAAERRPFHILQNRNLHKDGHIVMLETSGVPILAHDGKLLGYRGVDRDVTERKQLEDELKRQAHIDELTGLNNRRHFFHLAEQELARTKRYGGPFTVLMLDVDRFKLVNDTYGHQVGDRVLQVLSEVCVTTLRHTDILGRIGGEEFAVLMPQTSSEQGLKMAKRLRLAVAPAAVPLARGKAVRFTVSIGVTSFAATDTKFEDLLKRADTALYAAKKAGRNRVRSKHYLK